MREPVRPAIKLGVTGGIGSGKTTVCRIFSVFGIPVFSADLEARTIMNTNRNLMDQINTLAGKDLYIKGSLDREELAKMIFNNESLLEKVNSLVHPVVFEYFTSWVLEQHSPYAIMEAAILFESGAASLMDKILTVVTPVEERITRLLKGKGSGTRLTMNIESKTLIL
jgi:dephospho-CoA kinase